jgi:hypothetical protein
MIGVMHRLTRENYGSSLDFLSEVQRHAVRIAEGGTGNTMLGVWLDDNRKGVSMRLVRDTEMGLRQSWAWRPHRAFALERVEDVALPWLAEVIEHGHNL